MKLRFSDLTRDLTRHLQQAPASLYLIASNEAILLQETVKKIQQTAALKETWEHLWLSPSSKEDWESIIELQKNRGLFAKKQIIEIFLPNGKPGQTGATYLQQISKHINPDQILIIVSDKLDNALTTSRWFTALEPLGIALLIWPLSPTELAQWLQNRATEYEVVLTPQASQALLQRTQRNMLAIEQALQLLSLYPQPIDISPLEELIADQSQYIIQDFLQQLLSKKTGKSLQLLNRLQAQDVEPTWIIWQLAQFARDQKKDPWLHELYALDLASKGNPLTDFPWPDPWAALRHFIFSCCMKG